MAWNPNDPMELRRRIAWSVATSSCIETRKDPVTVYQQIMEEWDEEDKKKLCSTDETSESKESS